MGCTSSVILPKGQQIEVKPKQTSSNQEDTASVSDEVHEQITPEKETTTGVHTYSKGEQETRHHNEHKNVLDKINENDELTNEDEVDNETKNEEEYLIEAIIPQVYLDHVICLDEEKHEIKEIVDTFVFNFEDFTEVGMAPTKGILLHGPSGCGKSLLAEAFACKYAFNFISVQVLELNAPFVDKLIEKVDESIPCVLLLKHLDSVFEAENKKAIIKALDIIVKQIIDASKRIFVFGTASKVENVEPAILRLGRLEKVIHIPKPHKEARLTKWRSLLDQPNSLFYKCDLDFNEIADLTHGFTHADLDNICTLTLKNCGVTMDITSQRQKVVIRKEHVVASINEYHDISRGNSLIDVPD